MNAPIEAQSLSGLTNLFANPPQYPRNPTHQVHEPLVLYIVRVPGSRDVFLSPIKPPTKASISLDAVQSSLYYFHVNTAEDEEVKRSAEEHRKSEESSRPSVTISRKPLPPTQLAKHPLPPLPTEEKPYQPYQPYRPPLPERPQPGNVIDRGSQLRVETNTDEAHRKPIPLSGPSTIYDAAGDYALSPSIHENQSVHHAPNSHSGAMPVYSREAPPISHQNHLAGSHQIPSSNAHSPYTPASIANARRMDPTFTPVTIIRRDPSSGSQWNIGTITLLEPTFSKSNVKPVNVELNTPGYGRFARGAWAETPYPGSAGSDAASVRRAFETAAFSPAATTPDTPVAAFSRIVDFKKMAMSDLRRTVYQRTNSSDSMGKIDNKANIEKNVLAFTSPWQGTCTFVNAIDGKTLKIKHTISSNSSTGEGLTANVGELRFNLGWSMLGKVKQGRTRRKTSEPEKLPIPKLLETKKENFRRSFQHFRDRSKESFQRSKSANRSDEMLRDLSNIDTPTTNNLNDRGYPTIKTPGADSTYHHMNDYPHTLSSAHPTSSEDNEDDPNRLSLRLGRERAGGGFRGDSAKLGKLIIEDEGLKMCDLVVGAAMGVWWQHYGE